jgi:hypothetical protein
MRLTLSDLLLSLAALAFVALVVSGAADAPFAKLIGAWG